VVGECDTTLFFELSHDFNQDLYTGAGEIELAATVIGQDNASQLLIVCFKGILYDQPLTL
jgi:hypothetical protein